MSLFEDEREMMTAPEISLQNQILPAFYLLFFMLLDNGQQGRDQNVPLDWWSPLRYPI